MQTRLSAVYYKETNIVNNTLFINNNNILIEKKFCGAIGLK